MSRLAILRPWVSVAIPPVVQVQSARHCRKASSLPFLLPRPQNSRVVSLKYHKTDYSTSQASRYIRQYTLKLPNDPGHILVLALNSPHNKNALSRQLVSELHATLATVKGVADAELKQVLAQRNLAPASRTPAGQSTRAILITSDLHDIFCAGADLKERKAMSLGEAETFLTDLRATFNLLSSLPLPTIACIPSLALGGGLELALACTFRILSSRSSLGLPETRLGIFPGAGGTFRLPALVGRTEALHWILTGKRFPGPYAHRIGLAERLVSAAEDESGQDLAERVQQAGLELAHEICAAAPIAEICAFKAVGRPDGSWQELYDVVMGTEDRNEALRAFAEKKRKPNFVGI